MHIDDIELAEPFMSLFPRREGLEKRITESMAENGFYDVTPLVLWEGILIDGHHRYRAAKANKIHTVPAGELSFESEEDAIAYCIGANWQERRSDLTQGERRILITEMDRVQQIIAARKQKEGQKRGRETQRNGLDAQCDQTINPLCDAELEKRAPKSTKLTAEALGVSERSVQDVRVIEDEGTEEDKQEIDDGKTTIHKKAEEVRERRRP